MDTNLNNMDNLSNINNVNDINNVKYAGFWIRLASYLIDYVLMVASCLILNTITYAILHGVFHIPIKPGNNGVHIIGIVTAFIDIVVMVLYYIGMRVSKFQSTVGELVVGIKVVDMNYAKISWKKSSLRFLASILSNLILAIGYIMIAFTEKKQALHDKMADTYAVYRS